MATLFVWHIAQKHNHKPLSSHTTMSKHTPCTHTQVHTCLGIWPKLWMKAMVDCFLTESSILSMSWHKSRKPLSVGGPFPYHTTQCGWPIPIPHHSVWVAHSHATPCGVVHSHTTFTSSHKDAHIQCTCTETTQAMDSTEHYFNLLNVHVTMGTKDKTK